MGIGLFGSFFMVFLGPVMYTWTETKDLNEYNDLHIFEVLFVNLFSISFLITLILLFDILTLLYFVCLSMLKTVFSQSALKPFLSSLKYLLIACVILYAYKSLMFGEKLIAFFKMLLSTILSASLSTLSK